MCLGQCLYGLPLFLSHFSLVMQKSGDIYARFIPRPLLPQFGAHVPAMPPEAFTTARNGKPAAIHASHGKTPP